MYKAQLQLSLYKYEFKQADYSQSGKAKHSAHSLLGSIHLTTPIHHEPHRSLTVQ